MKVILVENCKYANEDGSAIYCEITLEDGKKIPFTACDYDDLEHGRLLHKEIADGKHGRIAPYTEPLDLYQKKRFNEYPEMGDQLDVIWKDFLNKRQNGETLSPEVDTMLSRIVSVKQKYPKPSEK